MPLRAPSYRWGATGSSVCHRESNNGYRPRELGSVNSVTVVIGRLFLCKLFSRSVDLGRGFVGVLKPYDEWLWARSVFRRRWPRSWAGANPLAQALGLSKRWHRPCIVRHRDVTLHLMVLGTDATGGALFWSRLQRQEAFRNPATNER